MFGESSLLGECSTTGTVERGFLAVVPDTTISILYVEIQHRLSTAAGLLFSVAGHAVVSHRALPTLAALVDLVLVPGVFH